MNETESTHGEAASESRRRNVAQLFRDAITAPEEDIYLTFVRELHKLGSKEVLDQARRFCESIDSEQRMLGADVLGQLGVPERTFPQECVESLLDLLTREQNEDVLEAITVALGHLRDPRAVEPLSVLTSHPQARVRFGVAFGLLGHACEKAIAALLTLMRDSDPEVRDWATFGIASQIESDTEEIRAALINALDDESSDVRAEAAMGLVVRGDPRAISAVAAELRRDDMDDLVLEAAVELASPELLSSLLKLKQRHPRRFGERLKRAIAECSRPDRER